MSTLFQKTDPLEEQVQAIKARINEEAKDRIYDKAWRGEVAQQIAEDVYKGFVTENIIEMFTDVEYLGLDDNFTIEEVRGLQAFWHGRDGYIEESDLEKDVLTIAPDTVGFHLVQSEDRLRTGFAETAETLVRLGRQRLATELNNRVLRTYQNAVGVGHPSYVGVNGLSLANINSTLASVRDASESEDVVILGRRTMTDKIVDALTVDNTYALYTPETNENLLSSGVLGRYRNAPIITLRNYRDGYGNAFFPANELWVIGRNAGKAAFFGETQFKEFMEDDNWFWHYILRQDFNAVLLRDDRVRRIVDATVS